MKLKIDDSFYQEEERCGYLVSAKMKRIWAVELDLLYQLQQICEKYGIKYYASGGTILGAERHKGMIPWDDDIDIMMLRDQYDLLCQHRTKQIDLPLVVKLNLRNLSVGTNYSERDAVNLLRGIRRRDGCRIRR